MKPRSSILLSAAVALALAVSGCSNQSKGNPFYLAVNIVNRPASIPVGGTQVFTATLSDSSAVPQWSILNGASTANPGTLTPQSTPANSILYTAPASPPIYTTPGYTQGVVTVVVAAAAPAGTSYPTATDSVSFFITGPVSVGLSPANPSVTVGSTQQFIGYAVGSVNNALTWKVNGIIGGDINTVGSISSPAGLYTAPANTTLSGGNPVTITATSQADPTKSASATVTLH
jgi:hypothetical protein